MPCLGDAIYLRVLIASNNTKEEQETALPIKMGEYASFYGHSFDAHVLIETIEEEAVTLEFLAIHPCSTRYDGKVQRLRREERFQCSFTHKAADGATERISFLAVYQSGRKEISCLNY